MNTGSLLYEKAKKIIPGGTQLLSKRPEMFLPDLWPSYYSRAKGCEVWDLDGKHYYDMSLMGVGANVLGYAFDPVDEAAKQAIENSGMCTLNAPEEVELAELLLGLHPWADMVRYAKAGGEAMAMAARIARAYTGKDIVLVCGYHGWHDWYLAANLVKGDPLAGVHLQGLEPSGVPRALAGSNHIFKYNDIARFSQLISEHDGEVAAVIMEPIRNDIPKDGFLETIRDVTREKGIVLIFDEISSGFRLCTGGSHLVLGVNPDMAVFAKAMTNGYPVSAVIGNRNIMNAAQNTFISSTFWTERIALTAAVNSIRYFRDNNVASHLQRVGKKVQDGWAQRAAESGCKITVNGFYPMGHFTFESKSTVNKTDAPDHADTLVLKTYFTQEMLCKGYLASTAFYASLAHTDEIIDGYLDACGDVFGKITEILQRGDSVTAALKGPVCHAGFERLN